MLPLQQKQVPVMSIPPALLRPPILSHRCKHSFKCCSLLVISSCFYQSERNFDFYVTGEQPLSCHAFLRCRPVQCLTAVCLLSPISHLKRRTMAKNEWNAFHGLSQLFFLALLFRSKCFWLQFYLCFWSLLIFYLVACFYFLSVRNCQWVVGQTVYSYRKLSHKYLCNIKLKNKFWLLCTMLVLEVQCVKQDSLCQAGSSQVQSSGWKGPFGFSLIFSC